jgi:DNA-binding NarL/FixJ family response regulator
MTMNRIQALFLSAQPCVLAALVSFFGNDPLITPLITDYDNFDDLKRGIKKFNVILFDDASLKKREIENISNIFFGSLENKRILYTGSTEKQYLQYFICLGINGIISKKSNLEEIRKAIIKVNLEDDCYLDYNLKDVLVEEPFLGIKYLSFREKQTLQLIKQGFKNKEIAEILFISIKTVEAHKENIKHKLKLKRISDFFKL